MGNRRAEVFRHDLSGTKTGQSRQFDFDAEALVLHLQKPSPPCRSTGVSPILDFSGF